MDTRVYLARCEDYEYREVEKSVARIFDFFGGAEKILSGGKKVLIKPNLLMDRSPEEATTTHPAVVAAAAGIFRKLGADVVIADSPGGPLTQAALRRVYRRTGMEEACAASGAALNYDLSSRRVFFNEGERPESFEILSAIAGADVVVGISKLKTHTFQYYTGAVKNCFGAIPGMAKAACHARISDRSLFGEMLTDLCECVAPAFSIIDGITCMDGKGPSGRPQKESGDPDRRGQSARGRSCGRHRGGPSCGEGADASGRD